MRIRGLMRLLAALMAGLLVFGACGSDSDDGGGTATDQPVGDGDTSGVFAAGCAEAVARFAEAQARVAEATGAALDGSDVDFDEVTEQIRALADAAPDDIADDFQVYADQLIPFYEGLAEMDLQPDQPPTQEQAERFVELGDQLDNEALETATTNIQDWFENECQ